MSDRRAVVVGASGGIGKALAEALDKRGYNVDRYSRSAPQYSHRLDLEDEDSIARAANLCARDGAIDMIIVATGVLKTDTVKPEKNWQQLDPAILASYFAINTIGPALVAKHFLPLLPRRGRSTFAVLSARVGSIGDNRLGGWYGYRASKAALNMMVKSLAIELARKRPEALCVALHPGTVASELSRPFQSNVSDGRLFTPGYAAECLLNVLERFQSDASGNCYAWDGSRIDP